MNTRIASVLAVALAAATSPAQSFDLIGVTFQGQILRIESATGATQVLGTMPLGGNAMAVVGEEQIWTTVRTGTTGAFHYHIVEIDPNTGATTQPFGTQDVGDLRGLAASSPTELLAVRDGTPSDQLVRIDTTTGAVTTIGPLGFASIQALDATVGGLVAWDLNAGMVYVDPQTGAATDPFLGVGGPAGLQWLASDPVTGSLLVGRTSLQGLDLQTGQVGAAVAIVGAPDLRGVEFTLPRVHPFGQGCGPSPRIGGRFSLASGQVLTTLSGSYAPGTLGVQVIGFSDEDHLGQPLPILLDPLLGTAGCRLHVSIAATQFGFADATGFVRVPITIPPAMHWQVLFAQHAAFEPALPGGVSTTQGLRIRTRL